MRIKKETGAAAAIEQKADKDCARWKLQIELAERRQEAWERRCERIIKRYRDERRDSEDEVREVSRMNIFWSNVQTLKPCLYARDPQPIVERRYLDRDDTGRVASTILERSLRYQLQDGGFHEAMEGAVLDYLLIGRGVAWHRFRPAFGPSTSIEDEGDDELQDRSGIDEEGSEEGGDAQADSDRESGENTEQTLQERILDASAEIEYTHWRDFLHSEARTWKEVMWVARRVHMSRKDLIDWFGKKIGNAVPLQDIPERDKSWITAAVGDRGSEVFDELKKAMVYEIWCKWDRKVYFIAKGYDDFLKEPIDDPLNLEGFWPCARPLFATITNDSLQPVPDFVEYQDQALEIDDLTKRINLLLLALKVAGVYDGSVKELARLLDEGHENKLIAVKNWGEFIGKGGMQGAVSFIPIDMIAKVLLELFQARDKIKQDLYEITGLADVIRGQADPRETATSVATKGRWGSMRLQDRQAQVARFARDNIALMGEIISEHFPDDVLVMVSGIENDDGVGDPIPPKPAPPPVGAPSPMTVHNGGPPVASAIPPGGPAQPNVAVPHGAPNAGPLQVPAASGQAPISPAVMAFQGAMQAWQQKVVQVLQARSAIIAKAIGLLRQDKLRGFRIDIETDSTIAQDAAEEKGQRVEFVKAASGFLEQMTQLSNVMPDMIPLAAKMMMFAIRGFRTGRDLESSFEDFIEKLEKDVQQKTANPQPNPEIKKQQLELQADQAKSQAEVQKAQIDAQASAQDNQRDMSAKQLDAQIAAQQAHADMLKMQQEAALRAAEFQQKTAEMQMEMRLMMQDHSQKMEQSQLAHRQAIERFATPPTQQPLVK